MIESFQHKGLRRFFEDDDGSKLPPDMVQRIGVILSTLHAAQGIEGVNLPNFRLHPLKGRLKASGPSPCAPTGGSSFDSSTARLSMWIWWTIIEEDLTWK